MTKPAKIPLKEYFDTSRAYSLIILSCIFLTGGQLYTTSSSHSSISTIVLSALAVFLMGCAGTIISDIEHKDTDILATSIRPIANGKINTKQAYVVSIVFLITGLSIIYYFSFYALILTIFAFFISSFYTKFKKYWWGGISTNFVYFSLVPVLGALTITKQNIDFQLNDSIIYLSFSSGAWITGYVILGYLKDISADKATGFDTFAVVFGKKLTSVFGLLLTIFAYFLFIFALPSIEPYSILLISISCFFTVLSFFGIISSTAENKIAGSLVHYLRGIIICFLSILVTDNLMWDVGIIAFLLFEITIYIRPDKTQI